MCETFEELYLLEFYVEAVCYNETTDHLSDQLGETIVGFKYFGNNKIEVREEDFCASTKPIKGNNRKVPLKSGKSCLFSLKSLQALPTTSYVVDVSVFRKLLNPETFVDDDEKNWEDVSESEKEGGKEGSKVEEGKEEEIKVIEHKPELFIGGTQISLYDSIRYLQGKITSKDSLLPRAKALDGIEDTIEYPFKNGVPSVEASCYLRNYVGKITGEIVFLVRFSCFGRTILTQFQLSEKEAKNYLYKKTDGDACCNKKNGDGDFEGNNKDERLLSNGAVEGGVKQGSMQEKNRKEVQGRDGDKLEEMEESKKTEKKGGKKSKPSQKQKLNGMTDKMKECPFGFNDQSGDMDLKTFCECMCRCVMDNMHNTQGKVTSPQQNDHPEEPPGSFGVKGGNQLFLTMPDKPNKLNVESKFASSIYYTQNGENVGESQGNVVNIRPETPKVVSTTEDDDAKQDVLILKLGRKRIAAGRKPKIEIEMRTPKFKDEKPEMEAKETQYLASDCPASKGKGKGKGSKDKGKKKKKK